MAVGQDSRNRARKARDVALALLLSYTLAGSLLFPMNLAAYQAFAAEDGASSSAPAEGENGGDTDGGADAGQQGEGGSGEGNSSSESTPDPQPATHTVTFTDGQGNTLKAEQVADGQGATAPEAPTREGYTFTGWDPADFSNITANLTVTAQWAKNTYTVTFTDGQGNDLKTQDVAHGEAASAPDNEPTREGYEFNGWDPADFSNITADLVVTAQWVETIYTLTYEVAPDSTYGIPQGGDAPESATGITSGTSYDLAAVPTTTWETSDGTTDGKAGEWTFEGWSLTQSQTEKVTAVTLDADTTVYGSWSFVPADEPHLKITVKLDDDDESQAFTKGERVSFVITVENDGDAPAEGIKFTDTLGSFVFDVFKRDFDTKSVAYSLIDDEGTVLKDKASAPIAWVTTLEVGKHVTLRGEFIVTEAQAKAGKVEHTVKAKTAGNGPEFASDSFTVKTEVKSENDSNGGGSTGESDDKEEEKAGPAIKGFDIAEGDPTVERGLLLRDSITVTERGKTTQLGAIVTFADFTYSYANKMDPPITITWSSSDEDVAKVDANGLVTPQGVNGRATITATGKTDRNNPDDIDLVASIPMVFQKQAEDGNLNIYYHNNEEIPLEGRGSSITFEETGTKNNKRIYAMLEYKGELYNSKNAKDGKIVTEDGDTIEFSFDTYNEYVVHVQWPNGGLAYIWADEEPDKLTTTLVITAKVTPAGKTKANRYQRLINCSVDAPEGWDSDETGILPENMKITVSWEMDPNPAEPATEEYVFTLEDLDQLSTLRQAYTMIRSSGDRWDYAYQTARGVKLVDLFNMCNIYEQDVYAIEVKSTDNNTVTTAFMSVSQFFNEPRYYYPNFYMDGNTAGAVPAFAMIAVSSNTKKFNFSQFEAAAEWKAQMVDNLYAASADLDAPDMTQPRLCIGALGTYAQGGRYSIKNVERIHVVLKGAPPADPIPEDEDEDDDPPEPDDPDEPEDPGNGSGSGDGKGTDGGSGGTEGDGNGNSNSGSGTDPEKGSGGIDDSGDEGTRGSDDAPDNSDDAPSSTDPEADPDDAPSDEGDDKPGTKTDPAPDSKSSDAKPADDQAQPQPQPQPQPVPETDKGDIDIPPQRDVPVPDKPENAPDTPTDTPEPETPDEVQTPDATDPEQTTEEEEKDATDSADDVQDSGKDKKSASTMVGTNGSDDSGDQSESGIDSASPNGQFQDSESGAAGSGSGKRGNTDYSVFQMISNALTQVPITILENPWGPYLVFIVDILVLAGATRFGVWYALQKRRPNGAATA